MNVNYGKIQKSIAQENIFVEQWNYLLIKPYSITSRSLPVTSLIFHVPILSDKMTNEVCGCENTIVIAKEV